MTASSVRGGQARVEVLGVRHHGPGSARSVARALDELRPDAVVIEGPPELDALITLASDPDLVPPVAGLVYAVDEPRRAAFYPFAAFSPEWVALRWSLEHGVDVRFADLPATHHLADDPDDGPRRRGPRVDPISALASAAGYDDPERWWEDAVEHRRTSSLAHFAHLREAMEGVRGSLEVDDDARREAFMRRVIRAEMRAGRERIAVVCGAYHAPALHPPSFPPVSRDNALLSRLPKVKVAATWAPWSSERLSYASGYGAGVRSPGWYHHLFVTPDDDVVPSWFVRVARALRGENLDASTASVVEATRLAGALAAVRGRPSVGLAELTDAARAVLTEGSDLPLRLIDRTLVIGEELGRVPESTPMVPLAGDLARQQKSLRLKATAASTAVQLDLRRESQLARSVLLHRLAVLDVPWGTALDAGRTMGTFKEAWELEWTPELSVAVIEASLYGTTVRSAAEARIAEEAAEAADLGVLGRLIEQCLLADLPQGLRAVVAALAERTARQHDTRGLLETVEPLARTCRYGDVRGVDVADVSHVLQTVVVRAAVGLRAACSSLDDDGAAAMRTAVEAAHRGVALVDRADLRDPWAEALVAVGRDESIHGAVAGRVNRLLLDGSLLTHEEAAARLSRRLSPGTPAPAAAAWLDGFLAGEALLLIHGDDLLSLIDEWLAGATEEAFEDLLPLVRRTFSRFQPAERRLIGTHLRDLATDPGAGGARGLHPSAATSSIDLDRAAPAVAAVARLLGLEVAS
ncbi:DUF5682 family protein [Humibacillus xanthopallidus]|uniref:Uncharacterized protein n=1 Tax=Humibacillus xanthopallidus TaxID=412689 RepID=A0A543I346_9MICO|nr:DUF5682 family protein [Humibacillus xanthopallidus]TQM64987.1 hypothetical protein FBY41_1369 [Humibacillus xanthopallidus]